MRIIAGEFKGRRIPFNNRKYGNARVTSDFVKKAVFSSLGEILCGKYFLDLFSCSGQIGLEACSRGAQVVINEPDRRCKPLHRTAYRQLASQRPHPTLCAPRAKTLAPTRAVALHIRHHLPRSTLPSTTIRTTHVLRHTHSPRNNPHPRAQCTHSRPTRLSDNTTQILSQLHPLSTKKIRRHNAEHIHRKVNGEWVR